MMGSSGGFLPFAQGIRVIRSSGTPSSVTGGTSEAILAYIDVPGGAMGPNSTVNIRGLYDASTAGSSCGANLRIAAGSGGTTGGTGLGSITVPAGRALTFDIDVFNKNDLAQQGCNNNLGNSFGLFNTALTAAGINTANPWTISINVVPGASGDTISLRSFRALLIPGVGWSPLVLGANLFAWWDAERTDLVTQVGGLVSAWTDSVGGFTLAQSSASLKPVYSSSSFNGRPGITTDGIDDYMELASVPGTFPTSATAGEIWAIVDALADNTDATSRAIFGYGGTSDSTGRRVYGTRDTTRKAVTTIGNGTTSNTAQNNGPLFTGRHVVRARIGATAYQVDVDAVTGGSTSQTPGTGTTRTRLGANQATTPGSYGNYVFSAILATAPLTAEQAAQMYAFFNKRI